MVSVGAVPWNGYRESGCNEIDPENKMAVVAKKPRTKQAAKKQITHGLDDWFLNARRRVLKHQIFGLGAGHDGRPLALGLRPEPQERIIAGRRGVFNECYYSCCLRRGKSAGARAPAR
jgi:hypothetical protein